jgi:hypothetical protein
MKEKMLKIFVGFDEKESVAWHVMVHSIFRNSKSPVMICPLYRPNLAQIHKRVRDPKQSNDFSFTRFLVPYLCDFEGFSVFFDCDMLMQCDVSRIFDCIKSQPGKAVYVVKHDYTPKNSIKYLNNIQHAYPRKNWSSVVVWNCAHPANRALTPEFVETASGLDLHRFTWLQDNEIGELDIDWNWLVGEYDGSPPDVKNIHWTIGGPYFEEYKDAAYSYDWHRELGLMTFCEQRSE